MPITPLKAFLSVAAVAVVGVTSAYVAGVFDRFIEAPSQTNAALPDKPTPDGPADATPKPDGSVGDVRIIREEVTRCREILSSMATDAGESSGEGLEWVALGSLL